MSFRPEMIHPDRWPAICALLTPAITDTTIERVIDDLLENKAQLWVQDDASGVPDAAAVTERFGDVLHCHLYGGDLRSIDGLIAAGVEHGKPAGITSITVEGRLGWERSLGKRGWRRKAVVMEMDLG